MYYFEIESNKEFCSCKSLLKCENTFSHHDHDDNEYPFYGIEIFKFFVCPACNSVTVILYSAVGNSYDDEENERQGSPTFHEYRRKILYAPKQRAHSAIPKTIAEVASQAESVLGNSPRASFILCRAALEEVCNFFEIPTEKEKTNGKIVYIGLQDRLSQLFKEQGISEDLQPLIYGVKELGDKGAHRDHLTFTKQVDTQEAHNLLELLNYILERLFVDKERMQEKKDTLEKLKNKILRADQ